MKDYRLIAVMEALGEKITSLELSLSCEQSSKKELEKQLAEKEKRINELERSLQMAIERVHKLEEGR